MSVLFRIAPSIESRTFGAARRECSTISICVPPPWRLWRARKRAKRCDLAQGLAHKSYGLSVDILLANGLHLCALAIVRANPKRRIHEQQHWAFEQASCGSWQ